MIDVVELISNPFVLVSVLFIIFALLYAVWSYLKTTLHAMAYDYVVDALFSSADLLLPVSLVGIDIGDWIGAAILTYRYYPRVGKWGTLLIALEAANFGVSFIPGIGEYGEIFFSIFPMVTCVVLYKHQQAMHLVHTITAQEKYITNKNPEMKKKIENGVKKAHELFEKVSANHRYEQFFQEVSIVEDELHQCIKFLIEKDISNIEKQLRKLSQDQQRACEQAIAQLQQQVDTDWQEAARSAEQLLSQSSSFAYAAENDTTGKREA